VGSRLRDDAERARARRALAGALAFAALAPEGERGDDRLALAETALDLGDAATARALFGDELRERPTSVSALRGLARASAAQGDGAGAKQAWDRLAAVPDLPQALREEVDRERARSPSPVLD
jgi:predicted Zn-dependent protease